MQAKIEGGQPEAVWGFGSNSDKFKSGFGAEGSTIIPPKSSKDYS
jgi:hypothetical protein